jgi:hypothetical protein
MLVWYAFRGLWLACSSGMSAAVTPSIRWAWTSMRSTLIPWPSRAATAPGSRATSRAPTSAASTYRRSPAVSMPATSPGGRSRGRTHADEPGRTVSSGRTTRPSSVWMYTEPSQGATYTDGMQYGWHRPRAFVGGGMSRRMRSTRARARVDGTGGRGAASRAEAAHRVRPGSRRSGTRTPAVCRPHTVRASAEPRAGTPAAGTAWAAG